MANKKQYYGLESLNLFSHLEANDGRIWFGAYDGVYRYDGNNIHDFKAKEPLEITSRAKKTATRKIKNPRQSSNTQGDQL